MIIFLIVMAAIPWSIIFAVTYLLYRRVKPQLQLLWATAKMAWAAQRAAQAIPKVDPDFPSIQVWAKEQELKKAQDSAGFKLVDADHVMKTTGKA